MNVLQIRDFFLSDAHAFSVFALDNQERADVHSHEFDELVIVRSGSGFHVINGQVEFIYKGDFFYVNAQDVHYYESTNKLSLINILLRKDRVFHFINDISPLINLLTQNHVEPGQYQTFLFDQDLAKVQKLIEVINTCCGDDPDMLYFSVTESAVLAILGLLCRTVCRKKSRLHSMATRERHIFNHLRQHYHRQVNWDILADESGIPKRTLFRLFKEITGHTPKEFQQIWRLLKAQELLRTTDHSLREIAQACGFVNAPRLTESYQRQFHCTPVQDQELVKSST